MILKFWAKGIRNLAEFNLAFSPGKSIVVTGINNQGKTNFLESLHLGLTGVSPFRVSGDHIVKLGESSAKIGLDFRQEDEDSIHRVYFTLAATGDKTLEMDGRPCRSFNQIKSLCPVSYISADILNLCYGSPEFRRSDLDAFCRHVQPGYGMALKQYELVLKQKNKTLKQMSHTQKDRQLLSVWNQKCCELAPVIVEERCKILSKLTPIFKEMVQVLTQSEYDITLSYKPFRLTYESSEDYRRQLREKLDGSMAKEMASGFSLYGPQRDDFLMIVNGQSAFDFYSRGMNRVFGLAYKLAQFSLMSSMMKPYPILLLDDCFSECHMSLKERVIGLVEKKSQVIYTSVIESDGELFNEADRYMMTNGQLEKV